MTDFVLHGDCLEVMATLEAESVDSIVSDPPYGLSFMGKQWDHGVPGVPFWAEALRVAKPGAYLVAFGGTRTYHRLTCAIEDAGWEIRDCLSWLYGSGFPKSHDVSKAIDKMDAAEEQSARRYRFTEWVRSTGVTARQINEATLTEMGNHYTTHPTQPAIMTREHLEVCRHLLGNIPEWVERECDIRSVESRNFAEREVVGKDGRSANESWLGTAKRGEKGFGIGEWDITRPATDLARQWQGWGTALKPAWEPIILARKPLIGTVAANVAQYGTGGINVDGCRIEGVKGVPASPTNAFGANGKYSPMKANSITSSGFNPNIGRWPANVVLDEEAAGMFPESRYFYTAKASRKEREAGLEGMPQSRGPVMSERCVSCGKDRMDGRRTGPCCDSPQYEKAPANGLVSNHHPTVKPIALMRWLCRLVTPPSGVVLDPFTGSGTTGCAAVLEGFRFVGIEREAEYVAIAEKRIAHWAGQTAEPDLFA